MSNYKYILKNSWFRRPTYAVEFAVRWKKVGNPLLRGASALQLIQTRIKWN